MRSYYRSFEDVIEITRRELSNHGKMVEVGHWQGTDVKGKPDMVSYELLNHSFTCGVVSDLGMLRDQIKPNLPWADDHFLERVGREGLNPGVQYANWPYYVNKANDVHRVEEGKFSHTYMERIWPNNSVPDEIYDQYIMKMGLRYFYGDLDSVVNLLLREPLTRQAFLPIWYPEDTGAVHEGRVPCTLGYHFMRRDGELHMWYPIRACDFIRHFRDDVYLACRLMLWVLDELKAKDYDNWKDVRPGKLNMHIYSLHVFANEVRLLKG